MINLNQRLREVSQFLKPGTVADIGSDHAYLPIYAVQHQLCQFAIAGEVVQGPYQAALKNVRRYELSHVIEVRLGDGLSVLKDTDQVDNITICGMGGPLIAKILTEGSVHLKKHPRLILQSNIQTQSLRQTLQTLNYHIIDEIIMEENNHIYEIVVAEYSQVPVQYDEESLKFGPVLLKTRNNNFEKKWQHELKSLYHIKQQLNSEQHQARLNEIDKEIEMIERVLKH